MANTKHATNDNTSGTVSLVYFVIPNVWSLDTQEHPDEHPSVHDSNVDCEHIDEVLNLV